MNLGLSHRLLAAALLLSAGAFCLCPDWYQNTLECLEMRKQLRRDSSNTLCSPLLEKLNKERKNTRLLLKTVYCLNEVAPPEKISTYRKKLKKIIPGKAKWYLNHLRTYRMKRELASALGIAYLAELKGADSRNLRIELTEIYRLSGQFLQTGLSYLKSLSSGKQSLITIQYGLDDLIKNASTEGPASVFLDSLISIFPSHTDETLSLLENICWNHRHYSGALKCFLVSIDQVKNGKLEWKKIESRLEKFLLSKEYSYCRLVLAKTAWRDKTLDYLKTQQQFIQIHYHLEDWQALIAEFEKKNNWDYYNWETRFYLAAAFLKATFGNSKRASAMRNQSGKMAQEIIQNAKSPWDYRAVLLRSESLIKAGDYAGAERLLQQEKNNPTRQEGTGGLLFWQAISKLYQSQYGKADSLLVIASAYTNEKIAQRALQIRYWLLQDTSAESRNLFFQGIEESPSTITMRLQSLNNLPESSPLYPYGLLEKALIFKKMGNYDSVRTAFKEILHFSGNSWMQFDVKSRLNFSREKSQNLDESLAIYDEILLKYQQGMVPEFVRERIRYLKVKSSEKLK